MTDDLKLELLINDQGKIIEDEVARYLFENFNFVTLDKGEILYIYHDDTGTWKDDGDIFVKAWVEQNLHELINSHKTNEIINHIKRRKYVTWDIFNKKIGIVNLKNGVYQFDTGKLLEHSPEYFFSYSLPFNYDKTLEPVKFIDFLIDICSADPKQIITILEGFAYTFIPGYPIQRAVMLTGVGANGKGTLLNVLKAFCGSDNCSSLKIQTICGDRGFSLAKLRGKLLNIGPDLPKDPLLDVGNFKAVTGGDRIDAEIKFVQGGVQFENSAKLWFTANQIPASTEDTVAFYRRWIILEFKKTYKEGKDILPELTTQTELAGIFNLIMELFFPIVKKNLRYTFAKEPELLRRDYMKSSDTVGLFYDEMCEYDPESDMPKANIYQAYVEYCNKLNLMAKDINAFWRRLDNIGMIAPHMKEGQRYIRGLAFKQLEAENDPEKTIAMEEKPDEVFTKYISQMSFSEDLKNRIFRIFGILDYIKWDIQNKINSNNILESSVVTLNRGNNLNILNIPPSDHSIAMEKQDTKNNNGNSKLYGLSALSSSNTIDPKTPKVSPETPRKQTIKKNPSFYTLLLQPFNKGYATLEEMVSATSVLHSRDFTLKEIEKVVNEWHNMELIEGYSDRYQLKNWPYPDKEEESS